MKARSEIPIWVAIILYLIIHSSCSKNKDTIDNGGAPSGTDSAWSGNNNNSNPSNDIIIVAGEYRSFIIKPDNTL